MRLTRTIFFFAAIVTAGGLLLLAASGGCTSQRQIPEIAKEHQETPLTLPDELRRSVTVLSQEIGERNCYRPTNLKRAADWIEQTLHQNGYKVSREVFHLDGRRFKCDDQDVWNLTAELPGTVYPRQVVIVGAHYDSRAAMASWHEHRDVLPDQRGTPGANDNGSGVAAVLALARRMAGQQPARTLRFCFWVNEEPPFYHTTDIDAMGSYVSAARSRQRGEDVRAVVSFDVAGCYSPQPNSRRGTVLNLLATSAGLPRTTDYVAFLAVAPYGPLVDRCAEAYRAHSRISLRTVVLAYLSPLVSWSDDWSYGRHGYPAFCVTDTAFLRSDYYHDIGDTAQRMDFAPFADVVWGMGWVIRDLAWSENVAVPASQPTHD